MLRVVAAAILEGDKVLLVSKRAAPEVFFLPGGKPEADEAPSATLARELDEELGVRLVSCEPLALVRDRAALERTPMEMEVYVARVEGAVGARSEIAEVAWADASGPVSGTLAPAIENHVLPLLADRGLIA